MGYIGVLLYFDNFLLLCLSLSEIGRQIYLNAGPSLPLTSCVTVDTSMYVRDIS